MTLRCTVFCAVSLDGFLARKDGALDWLRPAEAEMPPADTGYDAFIASVDHVVMGRNTFDVVLEMSGTWFYSKPVHVLTTRPLEVPDRLKGKVEYGRHSPAELVALMERRGAKRLYVDGGKTIQSFMKAGLIDDLIITQIPVLIGEGIPLFGPLAGDVRMTIESSRLLGDRGAVQTTYHVDYRQVRAS
jgi:dihydrofolate reductase